jgi:uncharacterized phiE125 gp8 family phage protein
VPFGNTQIVPPAAEPVDLSIAKSHLRVSGCDEDAYIAALVSGARQAAERECGLQFVTATYRLTLDDFPRDWQDTGLSFGANVTRAPFGTVHLPVGPVASVVSPVLRHGGRATDARPDDVFRGDGNEPDRAYHRLAHRPLLHD